MSRKPHKKLNYLHNEKGMALVSVLIISTVLAMVGSAHLSMSTQEAALPLIPSR